MTSHLGSCRPDPGRVRHEGDHGEDHDRGGVEQPHRQDEPTDTPEQVLDLLAHGGRGPSEVEVRREEDVAAEHEQVRHVEQTEKCGRHVGSRAPQVVGVSPAEAPDGRAEDGDEGDQCNRLDQFHRGDPDLSTRWGVDHVQQPDDDEPGHDGDGDGKRRDDPPAVGLVLLDRVDHT